MYETNLIVCAIYFSLNSMEYTINDRHEKEDNGSFILLHFVSCLCHTKKKMRRANEHSCLQRNIRYLLVASVLMTLFQEKKVRIRI